MLRLRWDFSTVLHFTTGVTICLNLAARANCQLPNVMMSKETITRHTIALRKCLWQRAETETGTHKKDMRNHTSNAIGHRRMMHLRKKLLRERERERESRVVESRRRRVILRHVVIFHRIQFAHQSGVPASIIIHVLSRRLLPAAVCDEQATHSTHSKAEKTLTDETSLDLDYM